MNNTLKAFTLIELLVTISIVSLLSSIVLSSLSEVRIRGKHTSLISNLNHIRTEAELYSDTHKSLIGICNDQKIIELTQALESISKYHVGCFRFTNSFDTQPDPIVLSSVIQPDWVITTRFNNKYYVVSDRGRGAIEKLNVSSTWSGAKQYCESRGKRLATANELMALAANSDNADLPFMIRIMWSENETSPTTALQVHMPTASIIDTNKNVVNNIGCVSQY